MPFERITEAVDITPDDLNDPNDPNDLDDVEENP